ncbi:MAG TPA: polysaccharide deacetylase family protein, partial [Longimicrobiaceae bacterium]|nr:polysaccharide deacetylase family protein [Longimicrobiaceae bacterium]
PAPAPVRGEAPAAGVPVLAWHFFRDRPTPEDGPLTESFAGFEETLVFLRENGFRSVFPEQVRPGGVPQVILTFDDGRRESLRAAEILERHGFRGIFFVIPARTVPRSEHFLGPEEVRRLARAGHRVAAHGYEHRSMPASGTEVAASLVRSLPMLRAWTGAADAPDFAFPFGHYTPEVAEALAGSYRYLHTVNPGYWDGASPLLPRMLIMSSVEPALYRDYLLGGGRYAPVLEPLSADGAVAGRVAFRARTLPLPEGVELFSISADATGRSYVSHPLGESLQLRGDTVWVDLAAHMGRYYSPQRAALSYALVARGGGGLRYLSPGVQHWLRDPAAGPRAASAPDRRGGGEACSLPCPPPVAARGRGHPQP